MIPDAGQLPTDTGCFHNNVCATRPFFGGADTKTRVQDHDVEGFHSLGDPDEASACRRHIGKVAEKGRGISIETERKKKEKILQD